MDTEKLRALGRLAADIRIGIIEEVHSAKSGHPGGSLSIADILAYLYTEEMNVDPKNPRDPDRDRFVLSKGHCAPALYSALAHRGYFPLEDLKGFRSIPSYLQGHPDMNKTPGVDMTSGSLGQGVSVACGMALAAKVQGKSYRVYSVLGDGETEEGEVWEAAMFAAHYKLDNLCIFIDQNGLQIDGATADVIGPEPHDSKYAAFGWNVITIDAHDFTQIAAALAAAKECCGKPTVIIAKSTKGKGVSFMENKASWHGTAPNDEQYATAIAELTAARDAI